jgi:hypothetical protein
MQHKAYERIRDRHSADAYRRSIRGLRLFSAANAREVARGHLLRCAPAAISGVKRPMLYFVE